MIPAVRRGCLEARITPAVNAVQLFDVSDASAVSIKLPPATPPLKGHLQCVSCVHFLPDHFVPSAALSPTHSVVVGGGDAVAMAGGGRLLLSGSWDGTVRVWDTDTSQPWRAAPVMFAPTSETGEHQVTCLAVAPCPTVLRPTEEHGPTEQEEAGRNMSSSPSPSSSWLVAIGSSDKSITLWDAKGNRQFRQLRNGGHAHRITSVAFDLSSADGSGRHCRCLLLASGSADGTIVIWNAISGEAAASLPIKHTEAVCCLAFSRDGATLVSGGADHNVFFWDVESKTQKFVGSHWPFWYSRPGHSGCVTAVVFAPQPTSQEFAVAGNNRANTFATASADGTILLWDVTTGEPKSGSLTGHEGEVTSLAFSNLGGDGRILASGSVDGTIRIWDSVAALLLRTISVSSSIPPSFDTSEAITAAVCCVAFSADGATLASGHADHTTQLWEMTRGELIQTLSLPFIPSRVAFSPDGANIVATRAGAAGGKKKEDQQEEATFPIAVTGGHCGNAGAASGGDSSQLIVALHSPSVTPQGERNVLIESLAAEGPSQQRSGGKIGGSKDTATPSMTAAITEGSQGVTNWVDPRRGGGGWTDELNRLVRAIDRTRNADQMVLSVDEILQTGVACTEAVKQSASAFASAALNRLVRFVPPPFDACFLELSRVFSAAREAVACRCACRQLARRLGSLFPVLTSLVRPNSAGLGKQEVKLDPVLHAIVERIQECFTKSFVLIKRFVPGGRQQTDADGGSCGNDDEEQIRSQEEYNNNTDTSGGGSYVTRIISWCSSVLTSSTTGLSNAVDEFHSMHTELDRVLADFAFAAHVQHMAVVPLPTSPWQRTFSSPLARPEIDDLRVALRDEFSSMQSAIEHRVRKLQNAAASTTEGPSGGGTSGDGGLGHLTASVAVLERAVAAISEHLTPSSILLSVKEAVKESIATTTLEQPPPIGAASGSSAASRVGDGRLTRMDFTFLSPGRPIGSGAFSDVFEGLTVPSGQPIALKRYRSSSTESVANAQAEVTFLRNLCHPNIVHCYGIVLSERSSAEGSGSGFSGEYGPAAGEGVGSYAAYSVGGARDPCPTIVLEYIRWPLKDCVLSKRRGTLTNDVKLRVTYDLISALAYLHESRPGIVHGDLKLENIMLVSQIGPAKLIDFGSASRRETMLLPSSGGGGNDGYGDGGPATTGTSSGMFVPIQVGADKELHLRQQASLHYRAPEFFTADGSCYQKTCEGDIYSLGVVLFELWSESLAWGAVDRERSSSAPSIADIVCLVTIGKRPATVEDMRHRHGIPEAVAQLIEACWAKDPASRPMAAELNTIKHHRYPTAETTTTTTCHGGSHSGSSGGDPMGFLHLTALSPLSQYPPRLARYLTVR